MNHIYIRTILTIIAAVLSTALPRHAYAFDASLYATESKLASGSWAKVSVRTSGMYMIPLSELRKMGFSSPENVRVYGYGGERIPDLLSAENYVDDLPEVRSVMTSRGLVFYARGPETWRRAQAGRYYATDNIYTDRGYYFLSDSPSDTPREIPSGGFAEKSDKAATVFNERFRHEQNLVSASENGWLLVGEDFRFTPARSFTISMPDRVEDTPVWLQTSVVAGSPSGSNVTMTYTVDGEKLPATTGDVINGVSEKGIDGRESVARRTFEFSGEKFTLGISAKASGTLKMAHLNYIAVNYTRHLRPAKDGLLFSLASTAARMDCSASGTMRVWDVTDPLDIREMNTTAEDGGLFWVNDMTGTREYAAWNDTSVLPAPEYEGRVKCQNLHASPGVDMVIVTPAELRSQAERIAEHHRSSADTLTVAVALDTEIYNEFSSGMADVSGIRKYLKMLYDRGEAEGAHRLKYVLLFGSATYDNRHLTEYFRRNDFPTLPSYYGGEASAQLSENDAYGTDDFIGLLADGSGARLASDRLSVAVGRIPARNITEARNTVDKMMRYYADTKRSSWKQQMVLVADDGNAAEHMEQADSLVSAMNRVPFNPINVNKIYIDAYDLIGGVYEGARTDMYRLLNEGAAWWGFIGHANTTSWTGEGILTYNDINNLLLKHPPMLFSATCEFLRWDSNVTSGCEILFHEPNGGIIGAISATRPVYISLNKFIATSLGASMSERDSDGRLLTVGEIYRRAKNRAGEYSSSGTNHRRYVLMGDPAMRPAVPDHVAVLDAINGNPVETDTDNLPVVGALQNAVFTGRITDAFGNLLDDFSGVIMATVNDAETSVTTHGNSSEGDSGVYIFEKQGGRLYTGAGTVENGRFSVNVSMPSEISDNFRPAQFLMYAYSTTEGDMREAAGSNRNFYVFGIDESVPADTIAPVIESCALNHPSFSPGDKVNATPMLLADVSDNVGINLSGAGIGHSMSVTIDGNRMLTDVSQYYTPAADGSPSGSIAYPLPALSTGNHSITLRVWDTSGNSTSESVDFAVAEGLSPEIFDVYTDTNPASESARFYLSHNRPDEQLTVTVSVYNLLGRLIWSDSITALSDMFTSTPLTWNLCDAAGRRVPRGIYVYRAEILTSDGGHSTASKRLAVTAQ